MPRHWLAGEVPWARPGDGRCWLRQEALCLGRRWPHPFCVAREPLDKAWRAKRQWEEFLPQALLLPRCHLLQEACPGLPGRVGHVPCSWPSITVSPSSLSGRPLSLEAGDCVQALALCPAGALQGSGSWLSMEQMVREPKEVGWGGRERRQGPALPWRTSSGSHSHGHSGSGGTRPRRKGGDKQEVTFPHRRDGPDSWWREGTCFLPIFSAPVPLAASRSL